MSLLKVKSLRKYYPIKQLFKKDRYVKALDGLNFELNAGETLAVVGESGCGKSTLAKVLMKLEQSTEGEISLLGNEKYHLKKSSRNLQMQMIFQDPYHSLNPRKPVWKLIAEPLLIKGLPIKEVKVKVFAVMKKVGLREDMANRYPHMFSGGQRQRIGIARALITDPKVIICDEPVSALDVSIQAQVLNLLIDLKDELNLSLIFITHDLSVVQYIADRVMVMYLGKIVEIGNAKKIFNTPKHPYTEALLKSRPSLLQTKNNHPLKGEIPSPLNPPSGCSFHTRCPHAKSDCNTIEVKMEGELEQQYTCSYPL